MTSVLESEGGKVCTRDVSCVRVGKVLLTLSWQSAVSCAGEDNRLIASRAQLGIYRENSPRGRKGSWLGKGYGVVYRV